MDSYNGVTFKSLGFIIMNVQGILSMPRRKDDSYYDWGNNYEPLVDADDIYHGERIIKIKAFYDSRIGNWRDAMEQLETGNTDAELVTEYGTVTARIFKVEVDKSFKNGKLVTMQFVELNPDLSGGMPNIQGDASVRIDGYDMFAQFGFLVESVKLFGVEELKRSRQTVHKSNLVSLYREPQNLEVKINGIYANKADMETKIRAFNALLAKAGLRHFIYHEFGFQCFADREIKVELYRRRVELTLNLKVMAYYNYDEIVQEVINQVNIQSNPQSDLAVTDPADPAFIKSKDTFVAADSSKLGAQSPAYYAKEQEIADLRVLDLAADLETATSNV